MHQQVSIVRRQQIRTATDAYNFYSQIYFVSPFLFCSYMVNKQNNLVDLNELTFTHSAYTHRSIDLSELLLHITNTP